MSNPRLLKRLLIAASYLVFFGLLGTGIYYAVLWVAPTCLDGKQNQNETGIDCGGRCAARCELALNPKEITTREIMFVPGEQNSFDVLAKIYNPNDVAGASRFAYTFSLRDASGAVLAQESGNAFILPQETKYLFAFRLGAGSKPNHATLEITDVSWERFQGYSERPRVFVVQQAYNRVRDGVGFGAATGLVVNESPYDFRSVTVKVVLRDVAGKPLAINRSELYTFHSKEQRDFRLVFPTAFPGEVKSYEMLVDADIYHSENFIKQYAPTTPF